MNRRILQFICVVFMILLALSAQSQITISQDNFLRQSGFTSITHRAFNPSSIPVPTEGSDQIWDYSNVALDEILTFDYFEVSENDSFQQAFSVNLNDLIFQGMIIPNKNYEAIDDIGWYELGRSSEEVKYSLTAISGGPNDTITFAANTYAYEDKIDVLNFPVTYQKSWTHHHNEITNFILDIAAFGLVGTPGNQRRTVTEEREVVGYGNIIIPKADGSPSNPMEVLMINVVETEVDSFFLGGGLAPPAILGAFGLVQGTIEVEEYYVFYRSDYGEFVASMDVVGAELTTFFYHPAAADVSTSVKGLTSIASETFPNPVSVGGLVTIEGESIPTSGVLSMFDVSGKRIIHKNYIGQNEFSGQFQMPFGVERGIYFYEILDSSNLSRTHGKILVE